ncbi:hypothetical protein LEMLEM_LOCUS21658 [Lemmus lemmus]
MLSPLSSNVDFAFVQAVSCPRILHFWKHILKAYSSMAGCRSCCTTEEQFKSKITETHREHGRYLFLKDWPKRPHDPLLYTIQS